MRYIKDYIVARILLLSQFMLKRHGMEVYSRNYGIHPILYRYEKLVEHDIDMVLDVGANAGQYATQLRQLGYKGKIISYEPFDEAFERLAILSSEDPLWEVRNCALGSFDGKAELNVSANEGLSSSLLEMALSHTVGAPDSFYTGKQTVKVNRLDSIISTNDILQHKIFLKLDAQGYEKEILIGAAETLDGVLGVQMELSIIELYKDAPLISEMIDLMRSKDYMLVSLEPAFRDYNSNELVQVDGIFFREPSISSR